PPLRIVDGCSVDREPGSPRLESASNSNLPCNSCSRVLSCPSDLRVVFICRSRSGGKMKHLFLLFCFALGWLFDPPPLQVSLAQVQQEPAPFGWDHFESTLVDGKASYVTIGLNGGMRKYGLNIECLSKGAGEKLKAYVWVDQDELDRNADIRFKWDNEASK